MHEFYIKLLILMIWVLPIVLLSFVALYGSQRIKKKRKSVKEPIEGISVLKPLKGYDPGLEKNLESFFHLDFPKFELVFSVANKNDPALDIVKNLIARHPHIDTRIIVGAAGEVPNPKVDNLLRGYRKSKYDRVLISDSNIRVEKQYLWNCYRTLDESTGVVTAIVRGRRGFGLIGKAEQLTLNTFCSRGQIIGEIFNQKFVLGKSMFFRKSVAKRFGGLKYLGRYLAEDFMCGEAIKELGLKIKIMTTFVDQQVGPMNWRAYFNRHLRWARLRKAHSRAVLSFEVILNPIFNGLLAAAALHSYFGVHPVDAFLINLGIFMLLDAMYVTAVLKESLYLSFPLVWMIKEVHGLSVWLTVWSGNTVLWRGRKIAIDKTGIIHEDEFRPSDELLPLGSSN